MRRLPLRWLVPALAGALLGCNTARVDSDHPDASLAGGDGAPGGVPDGGGDAGAGSDPNAPPPRPVPPANAVVITCANTSADAATITAGLAAQNAVVLHGTCDLGTTTLALAAGAFVGGDAAVDYSGNGYAMHSSANGVTVTGLAFHGGGIQLDGSGQNGWSIVFDSFVDITSGADAVHLETLKGAATAISHNTFKNIWQGGYPNLPSGMTPAQCGQDCLAGNAIFFHNGIDNTTIDDNTLDEIGYDGIKGFWDGFMGKTDPYLGHHVTISNNTITHYHRIGIEVQAQGQGNCPGGCDYTLESTDGTVVKNNFVYLPALMSNAFAYSVMIGGSNAQVINNTGNNDVGTCYVRAGIGLENSLDGGILQGNVIGSVPQSCSTVGWADFVSSGYTKAGKTDTFQNNVICGPSAANQGNVHNGQDPDDNATLVEVADLWTNTCPAGTGNISASKLTLAFSSAAGQSFTGGGQATFTVDAISNLSIKQVAFYVDGGTTPVAFQEVQDVNTAFVADQKWHYHAAFDTTSLAPGSHTIAAIATDVANTTQTVTQTFTR